MLWSCRPVKSGIESRAFTNARAHTNARAWQSIWERWWSSYIYRSIDRTRPSISWSWAVEGKKKKTRPFKERRLDKKGRMLGGGSCAVIGSVWSQLAAIDINLEHDSFDPIQSLTHKRRREILCRNELNRTDTTRTRIWSGRVQVFLLLTRSYIATQYYYPLLPAWHYDLQPQEQMEWNSPAAVTGRSRWFDFDLLWRKVNMTDYWDLRFCWV